MQNTLVLLFLTCLVSACQPSCPPVLERNEDYEGDGFLISQDPANNIILFYPACSINPQHYLSSLTANNLGRGITVEPSNLQYAGAILSANGHFNLTKYRTHKYTYQGVFIVPARLKYRNLQLDNPVRTYPVDYTIDRARITTPYARAFIEVDTLIILPYFP
ncbi:hypothetical protein SAMN00120144_4274 [Hymenobacter roseosalivarius DSM 11622]|uniref:Uncharacterized protein n=1 Tax=Hymenobacter roseosalivarius DSM 11622 TaxID=645990 RepID=A0A1W1UJR5_9BACT|nr:hypothetical protein [Hymenobacter roseosalivarius]SMB81375.1 hypothetical protein SAMN00120144_4274 [Hymenobacter roseosalivarius DSM 11622]